MQPQQPVIRTYRGRERRSAEEAYRLDAAHAERAAWYPVAHRWVSSWQGEELSVVFEYRPFGYAAPDFGVAHVSAAPSQPATPFAAPAAAPVAEGDAAMPRQPDSYAEAEREAYSETARTPEPAPVAGIDGWEGMGEDMPGAEPADPVALADPAMTSLEPVSSEATGEAEPDADAPVIEAPDAAAPEGPAEADGPDPWDDLASAFEPPKPAAVAAPPDVAEPESQPAVEAEPVEAASPVETLEPDETPEPVEAPEPAEMPEHVETHVQVEASAAMAASLAEPTAPIQASSKPAVRVHARAVVQAIDLHAAGEPLRLIRSGFPSVPSMPILERRRWLKQNADYARRVLMWEPRGHRDMYGAILLPPFREDADIAVLFMHNEGYSTMCGHGIIAITTGLIEEGLYPAAPPQTVIRFETPAGLVTSTAQVSRTGDERNEVSSVRFVNVPSYLHESGLRVQPEGVALHGRAADEGSLNVDLAFGGAYYGVVDAADLGLRVVPEQADALTRAGTAITDALRRDHTPTHPTDPDLGFVYGTIIVDHDPASAPDDRATSADIRNVTIFAEGEVDRSPCGSGTSALLAQMHALGTLAIGKDISNASITGEVFLGRVEGETQIGDRPAVVTSVQGNAYVTGYHTFVVDDRDPLGNGFLLR